MKKIRIKAFTSILIVFAFSATIYTSCRKEHQNSSIVFQNDTYTPIVIKVNNSTTTIPVGGSVSYTGSTGSVAAVTASTSGSTNSGSVVGGVYSWSFSDNFPSGGGTTRIETLDVDASYFYLKVRNVSPYAIASLSVNYGSIDQTTDNVYVPNDNNVYEIGYYKAYSNTEVYATSSTPGVSWPPYTPSIPNTINATTTVTFY